MIIYNGAGISRAAGLNDLASVGKQMETGNRKDLKPTRAHHAITALFNKGYIHKVVTQNHDGLHQKSGMPWSHINEIHGGWFDRKNIVKVMDDKLDKKKL